MNSRALVTGASTGLGVQFAHLFAADGIDVAITSSPRSAARIEELADTLRRRVQPRSCTTLVNWRGWFTSTWRRWPS